MKNPRTLIIYVVTTLLASASTQAGELLQLNKSALALQRCETLFEKPARSRAEVVPIASGLEIRKRHETQATIDRIATWRPAEPDLANSETSETLRADQSALLEIARSFNDTKLRVSALRQLGQSLSTYGPGPQIQMPFIELVLEIGRARREKPEILEATAEALAQSLAGPGFRSQEVFELIECLSDRTLSSQFRLRLLEVTTDLITASNAGPRARIGFHLLSQTAWSLAASGREGSALRQTAAKFLGYENPDTVRDLDRRFKELMKLITSASKKSAPSETALVDAIHEGARLEVPQAQLAIFMEALETLLAKPQISETKLRAILDAALFVTLNAEDPGLQSLAHSLVTTILTDRSGSPLFRAAQTRAATQLLKAEKGLSGSASGPEAPF